MIISIVVIVVVIIIIVVVVVIIIIIRSGSDSSLGRMVLSVHEHLSDVAE